MREQRPEPPIQGKRPRLTDEEVRAWFLKGKRWRRRDDLPAWARSGYRLSGEELDDLAEWAIPQGPPDDVRDEAKQTLLLAIISGDLMAALVLHPGVGRRFLAHAWPTSLETVSYDRLVADFGDFVHAMLANREEV